jgi:hypothetical protein
MSPLKLIYSLGKDLYSGGTALFTERWAVVEFATRSRKGLHKASKTINKAIELITIFQTSIPLTLFKTYSKAFSEVAGALSILNQINKLPPNFSRGNELKGISQLLKTATKVCTVFKYLRTYEFVQFSFQGWLTDTLKIGTSFFALAGFVSQFRNKQEFEKYCLEHYEKYTNRLQFLNEFLNRRKAKESTEGVDPFDISSSSQSSSSSSFLQPLDPAENNDRPDPDPDGAKLLATFFESELLKYELKIREIQLQLLHEPNSEQRNSSENQNSNLTTDLTNIRLEIGRLVTLGNGIEGREREIKKLEEQIFQAIQKLNLGLNDPHTFKKELRAQAFQEEVVQLHAALTQLQNLKGYNQTAEQLLEFEASAAFRHQSVSTQLEKLESKVKQLGICVAAIRQGNEEVLRYLPKLIKYKIKKWNVHQENNRTASIVRSLGFVFHSGTVLCGAVSISCLLFGFSTPVGLLILGKFIVRGVGYLRCYYRVTHAKLKALPVAPIFVMQEPRSPTPPPEDDFNS